MKIQSGRYYRRIDNKVVGPARKNDLDQWVLGDVIYTDFGTFMSTISNHPHFLVDEVFITESLNALKADMKGFNIVLKSFKAKIALLLSKNTELEEQNKVLRHELASAKLALQFKFDEVSTLQDTLTILTDTMEKEVA